MSVQLRGSKSPNLPLGPVEYAQRYQDQLNNILRLYFNQLDNITGVILGPNPGQVLNLPFIGASDTTDQYATANDTATVVKFNTLDGGYGFTLNAPGSATANYDGNYKIDYSIQFANTANAIHTATVWLKINNSNVTNSTTFFSIPARKSATAPAYICGYSTITFALNAGDEIELFWATDQAYNPTGPVDGVYLLHEPAQTTPYAHPAVPSVIGAISFLSRKAT